jgi:hypothetical protein
MAIISGMEAAKVDDVKPFELPVDALAEGIKVRQGRYDKAKELSSKGAAELMFDVRDLEEDYAERQKVIDEYNDRISKLSESVDGDWSQLDNSQIQAEAIKSAQDKRVGHLKMAKKQADEYEKIAKEIEKDHGFVERFGEDANTQTLYNKDGSLRNLEQWSLQGKLDHVKAANDYYVNTGKTLREKFELIHSTSKEYSSLSPQQKEELWYDFWVNKQSSNMDNHAQIDEIKNFLIEDYRQTDAGKQYWNILKRDALKSGKDEMTATKIANDATYELVQRIGASKYLQEYKVTGQLQMNNKPQSGGGGGNNTGNNNSAGNGAKEAYNAVQSTPVTSSNVTVEGYRHSSSTLYEDAKAIKDTKYNIESLPANFTYGSIKNVNMLAEATVLVPHRTKDVGTAKNVIGTVYGILDGSLDNLSQGALGDNPAAARILDDKFVAPDSPNFDKSIDANIALFKNNINANGNLSFSFSDMKKAVNNMARKQLEADKMYQNATFGEKQAMVKGRAEALLVGFNGVDGDVASTFNAKYDDDKGYPVYTMREEYAEIEKVIDDEIKEYKDLLKHPGLKPGDDVKINKMLEYAEVRKEALNRKIGDIKETLPLLNIPLHNAMEDPEIVNDPRKIKIIRDMEGVRGHSKSLSIIADQKLFLDNSLAKQSGLNEAKLIKYRNPELAKDAVEKGIITGDIEKIQKARLNAACVGVGSMTTPGEVENLLSAITTFEKRYEGYDGPNMTRLLSLRKSVDLLKNIPEAITQYNEDRINGNLNSDEINTIGSNAFGNYNVIQTYLLSKAGFTKDTYEEFVKHNSVLLSYVENVLDHAGQIKEFNPEVERGILPIMIPTTPGAKTVRLHPRWDAKKTKQRYDKNFASEILKSGATPEYTAYIVASNNAKKSYEASAKNYIIVDDGTAASKALKGEVENAARQQFSSAVVANVVNPSIRVKRKQYNEESGVMEEVDLSSTEIDEIIASYSKSGDPSLSLSEIVMKEAEFKGLRADYYNDVSIGQDGYTGHFINADFNFKHTTPNGTVNLEFEIAMPNISVEAAVAMGFNNYTIEYGQQVAAGLTASDNTGFKLTSPPTKYTNSPFERQYHLIAFDMVIGGVQHKKGTVIELKNYNPDEPLYKQLRDVQQEDYVVHATIEAATKNFHDVYVKPSTENLKYAMEDIERLKKSYSRYMSNPQKMEGLMKLYEREGTWEAFEKAGRSFDKMQSVAVQKANDNAYNSDRKDVVGAKYDGSGRKLTSKGTQGAPVDLIGQDNNIISWKECVEMPTTELEFFYKQAAAIQESRGKKGKLNTATEVIRKNISGEVDTRGEDGQLYFLSKENYIKVGDKMPVKSVNRGKGFYSLFETNSSNTTDNAAKTPIVIAKESAPNILNKEAADGFDAFFNYAHAQMNAKEPFEVSSTTRSLNSNLHVYKNNIDELTNSDHFRGTALDISTVSVQKKDGYSTGIELYKWCQLNSGDKGKLKEMGIYVLKHSVVGGEDHLHIEYVGKNSSKAGLVTEEKPAELK